MLIGLLPVAAQNYFAKGGKQKQFALAKRLTWDTSPTTLNQLHWVTGGYEELLQTSMPVSPSFPCSVFL